MSVAINTIERLHAAVYLLLRAIDQRYPKHRIDSVERALHHSEEALVIKWQSWMMIKILQDQELADMPGIVIRRRALPPRPAQFSFFDEFFDGIFYTAYILIATIDGLSIPIEVVIVKGLVGHLNSRMPKLQMPSGQFMETVAVSDDKSRPSKNKLSLKK